MEIGCACLVISQVEKRTPQVERAEFGFVHFPLPSYMICRMILLGIALMSINLWQRRLWTSRLGQDEVPEMLLAGGKQSLCIRSALTKTSLELVENTSRKTIPHFTPMAMEDQTSRGAREVAPQASSLSG